jgi:hypothetical protein
MIRDRGTIKWTAMMLPEHVKLLREWQKEDEYQTKPELDEQQLEAMNDTLCEAMASGQEVMITYFEQKKYKLLVGTIHYYDEIKKKLHVVDSFGNVHYLAAENVVDVRT